MLLRLDEAQRLAGELGFPATRKGEHELMIRVRPDAALMFVNWPDAQDNLIGFEGALAHSHDGTRFAPNGKLRVQRA